MADEQHTVRSVSWNEIFGFSHIFKSFKMAIHPSKLLLALLAIALTWVLGAFVMDPIWSGVSDSNRVEKNEAWGLWTAPGRSAFLQDKDEWLNQRRISKLKGQADRYRKFIKLENFEKVAREDFGEAFAAVKAGAREYHKEAVKNLQKDRQERQKQIEQMDEDKREDAGEKADDDLLAARQKALNNHIAGNAKLEEIRGGRIFASFLDWQKYCLSNAFSAVARARFTAGLRLLYRKRGSTTPAAYLLPDQTNRPAFIEAEAPMNDAESYGLLAWLALMAWGLWWMFWVYPAYAILYVLAALAIWAFFGGAICRIAALHAAREEKISIVAAMRFGCSKFVSLFSAPLLPLAGIVFMGLCLAVAGLVGSIPYFGEWALVVLFALPLIAGAISAFLAVGLVGGAPLMWPTIAVEGSDNFDAFSRSFSYVYARPFRYGLYWLVAAVYGTICYLFVRLFAFIGLRCIHHWSGWAMGLDGKEEYATGAGKLDVMWAQPTFGSFQGPMQWEAMSGSEAAASVILALWVYLISGIVLAFLACFVLSAATNIYFLLRRRVDATDLDDVHVEEVEEEVPPPPAEGPAEGPAEAPDEEAPAEEKPAQGEGGEEKTE